MRYVKVYAKMSGSTYHKIKGAFKKKLKEYGLKWNGTLYKPDWIGENGRVMAVFERDDEDKYTKTAIFFIEGSLGGLVDFFKEAGGVIEFEPNGEVEAEHELSTDSLSKEQKAALEAMLIDWRLRNPMKDERTKEYIQFHNTLVAEIENYNLPPEEWILWRYHRAYGTKIGDSVQYESLLHELSVRLRVAPPSVIERLLEKAEREYKILRQGSRVIFTIDFEKYDGSYYSKELTALASESEKELAEKFRESRDTFSGGSPILTKQEITTPVEVARPKQGREKQKRLKESNLFDMSWVMVQK